MRRLFAPQDNVFPILVEYGKAYAEIDYLLLTTIMLNYP
jgi:hypothetical protein